MNGAWWTWGARRRVFSWGRLHAACGVTPLIWGFSLGVSGYDAPVIGISVLCFYADIWRS